MLVRERGADLVVIEGMGRAVHTNYHAALCCESLKLAVIKNSWLAERLGGQLFSVMLSASLVAQMVKNPPASAGDLGSIPGSGKSPGEGYGHPLQCSCLENPRDRGAWWAAVYGVAQTRGSSRISS